MALPSTSRQRLGRGGSRSVWGSGSVHCSRLLRHQCSLRLMQEDGRHSSELGGQRGHRPGTDSSVDRLQVYGDLSLCLESTVSHQHQPMLLRHQHHCSYQCPLSLTSTVTPWKVRVLPHPCLPQHHSILPTSQTPPPQTSHTSLPLPASYSPPPPPASPLHPHQSCSSHQDHILCLHGVHRDHHHQQPFPWHPHPDADSHPGSCGSPRTLGVLRTRHSLPLPTSRPLCPPGINKPLLSTNGPDLYKVQKTHPSQGRSGSGPQCPCMSLGSGQVPAAGGLLRCHFPEESNK